MSDFVRDLLVVRRALAMTRRRACGRRRRPKRIAFSGGASESNPLSVFPADSKSGHIEEPKFPLQQVARPPASRYRRMTCGALRHDRRGLRLSPLALKALVNHALGNDVTSDYVRLTVDRLRSRRSGCAIG